MKIEYCKNCGAKIDSVTGCCVNCGTHADARVKKNPVMKLILVFVAAVAVLLGVKTVTNLVASKQDVATDNGYLDVVEDMIDAVYVEKSVEKFAGLMPESVISQVIEKNYGGDETAFQTEMANVYAELMEVSVDENSIEWNIKEEIDVVGVQLDQYEELFAEETGVKVKIRSAKALDLTVSYTVEGEEKTESMYVLLGLIDGKWYLISFQ